VFRADPDSTRSCHKATATPVLWEGTSLSGGRAKGGF